MTILGLHHITLGCSNAQQTVDFYTGVLGLGFIKKTVNFDSPDTYHLYFADDNATPGTAITFFEWPDTPQGHPGVGGTHHFALTTADTDSLLRWKRRLTDLGISVDGLMTRENDQEICFHDPDGVILKITAPGGAEQESWPSPVEAIDPEMALNAGMHHITAICSNLEQTHAFYGDLLGMRRISEAVSNDQPGAREWVWAHESGQGGEIRYFQQDPQSTRRARIGVGQTHHFAFAVADDETQNSWRERLLSAGLPVSPVMDRLYFHSIYTRDPDGHVVELATLGPGFAADEPLERLGEALKLPPWYESHRDTIVSSLRPIHVPRRGEVR